MDYAFGLFRLDFWGYALYTLIVAQITIAGVTLYLHRDQAHRGLDLHPVVRHFFRFWLWMTTGISTKEWVAVHRKHHAHCETEEDPHSPQIHGLKKVLLEGAELYKDAGAEPGMQDTFGRGTPDDWIENNLYRRGNHFLGIALMLLINVVLFGVVGITIFAIQMMTIPFCAAGIINGVGHHTGYRNYECSDAARNIVPWGVFLGGEELHNNHHAFPSSSRFSMRPWEFDIGWMYITVLKSVGLAKVRRVAPRPVKATESRVDLETLRAVIVNRMHVLREYSQSVTLPVLRTEVAATETGQWQKMLRKARKVLVRQPALLDERKTQRLKEVLENHQSLKTVHEFRERLQKLWDGATVSNEKLLADFREWLAQAEASGIKSLQEFARSLASYRMEPAAA
ncbi:MAG: fatty acid desaturase [Pseudomonadota bacterium]